MRYTSILVLTELPLLTKLLLDTKLLLLTTLPTTHHATHYVPWSTARASSSSLVSTSLLLTTYLGVEHEPSLTRGDRLLQVRLARGEG